MNERMKREIFQSPCFDLIRKATPDFIKFIDEKCEAIAGDIVDYFILCYQHIG